METMSDTARPPFLSRANLDNSVWYGSALITLLATAEMTGGHYAMQRMYLSRGFAPPAPHRHGPEDFYILRGQVRFWVASAEVVAVEGDFVHAPSGVWHTLRAESEEAEVLIIFSPPGLEAFFQELSRPAEALEMPAGRVGPPDPDRIRAVGATHGIEFSPPGTTPADMSSLP